MDQKQWTESDKSLMWNARGLSRGSGLTALQSVALEGSFRRKRRISYGFLGRFVALESDKISRVQEAGKPGQERQNSTS